MARLAILLAASSLFGCVHPGYHVGTMVRLYRQGRIAEALDRAVAIEADFGELPPIKQAHYCIYRGALHVALSQPGPAQMWLGRAVQMVQAYPGLVTPEHGAVLDQALGQLQVQLNVAPPGPPPPSPIPPPPPAVPAQPSP